MASNSISVAQLINLMLVNKIEVPDFGLTFDPVDQFRVLHTRGYLPREMQGTDVHSFVVCNSRTWVDVDRDRCASRYEYSTYVVVMKYLETYSDSSQIQPASFDELDSITSYAEWVQDIIGKTRSHRDSVRGSVQITDLETLAIPSQEEMQGGLFIAEFELTSRYSSV